MEIMIRTSGNSRKSVESLVERFNGILAEQNRGEVIASINDDDARSFKFALEVINGVVEYAEI